MSRAPRTMLAATAAAVVLLAMGAAPAFAGALWRLDSVTAPTYLTTGQPARVIATASNIGDQALDGSGMHPVVIADRLPAGLQIAGGQAVEGAVESADRNKAAAKLECSVEEAHRREASCRTLGGTQQLAPFTEIRMVIPVEVLGGAASGEQNAVSVSGGEPAGGGVFPPAGPLEHAITVKDERTPFGVERYELAAEEEDGATDTQAGSHPFQLTTLLDLNEALEAAGVSRPELLPSAPALARNLSFQLPPGLLGDPLAIPQCSDVDFSTIGANNVNACPADTAVGVALVTLNLPNPPLGAFSEAVPVFNLAPAPGEPARFGFEDQKVPVILDTAVRSGGDYGVTVTVQNATQVGQVLSTLLTLWGQPGAQAHDGSRGWACIYKEEVNGETCGPPAVRPSTPFLTLPASCTGELWTSMQGEAWDGETAEARFALQSAPGEALGSLTGCGLVPFSPGLGVVPVEEREGGAPGSTVSSAASPAGWNITVGLPAEEGGLGEAAVRDSTVVLPAGVQLDPSAANGLAACSEGQIGFEAPAGGFDPLSPGAAQPMRFSDAPAGCPAASKVGSVRISSPDLAHELEGGVFVAEQERNPFGSLFALYIAAEDPASGVRVKLAGEVSVNEETGQLTTTFAGTPQVPLGVLRIHLFEGPRAALSTPPVCGTYTTTGQFTPWSSSTATPSESSFAITSAPGGCGAGEPFSPSLSAGPLDEQAGAFTPFTLTLTRPDGDQALRALTVHLPAGMAADLASITPCAEPQAGEGHCGPESLIGVSTAMAGLGPDPVALPGQVYLTGPYHNQPFGIEDITPAVAGPFDLGTVIVRSTISVDPASAAVTITSDPIPTILKGVPSQIKQLNITVNRPGFQFNATSCTSQSIQTTVQGAGGASATLPSPYQPAGCTSLPFHPTLSASAAGQGSKANGTSFSVTVTSGGLDAGGVAQSGIAKVDLQLPKALSSRLPTLQKACLAATFEANPGACPEGSLIGKATIHTPILKNPLTGPAYLVSHGNAEFPDVEFVLEGEGIKLILDGHTSIKNGITYSRFESTPDAPFTSFETTLPAGPHGILTPNVAESEHFSLCKTKLEMPTEITAQNGAVIKQTTNVTVTGCHGVLAAKTKLTPAQIYAKALAKCRSTYKHNKHKRQACEAKARATYTHQALTACRKNNPHNPHKRKSCEQDAKAALNHGRRNR